MARMRAVTIVAVILTLICGALAWQLVGEHALNDARAELIRTKDVRIGELERALSQLKAEVNRGSANPRTT